MNEVTSTPPEKLSWRMYELSCDITNAKLTIEAADLDILDGIESKEERTRVHYRNRLNAVLRAAICLLERVDCKMDIICAEIAKNEHAEAAIGIP